MGYAWIQRNYTVLFTPTYKLVGGLLRAKRDYELERELHRLDRCQVVILIEFGKEVKSVRAEEAARRNGIVLGAATPAQTAAG